MIVTHKKKVSEKERVKRVKLGLRMRKEMQENQEVFECLKKGESVLEIVKETGLTVAKVKAIIARILKIQHVHGAEELGRAMGGVVGEVAGGLVGAKVGGPVGSAIGAELGQEAGAQLGAEIGRRLKKR